LADDWHVVGLDWFLRIDLERKEVVFIVFKRLDIVLQSFIKNVKLLRQCKCLRHVIQTILNQ
jgi:hypothetical protein